MSILIRNGTIITMDPHERIIKDGAIYVKEDKIADIGKTESLRKKYRADHVIDGKGKIIIPGLINAHAHIVSNLIRDAGTDKSILPWLRKVLWPAYMKMTGRDAHIGALAGCIENLKNGATFVADNYYPNRKRKRNADQIARSMKETGMRATLVRGYHDKKFFIPEAFIETADEIIKEYSRLISTWHNSVNGRIKVAISPTNLLYVTPELVKKTHELAEKHGLGFHTHVAEGYKENEQIIKEYGKGYIETFNELNVLGPNFFSVHSVWVSTREIELLSKTDSRVIYNPTSNMFMASGVAPISKMLRRGIKIALGTDNQAANGNNDMIELLKFAVCLQKVHTLDPLVLTAKDVFRMATIDGARALRMDREIGSLEVGKKADIVVVDMRKSHIVGYRDPVASLVYSANGSDADSVIIDGNIVMENREVKTVDEYDIIEKAQKASANLLARVEAK